MAEVRSPGLPRYRTFQSQPELARRRKEHGKPLAAARARASVPQLPAVAVVNFQVKSRLLPREALASLLALVFPLRFAPVWIFRLSRFCVRFLSRGISSSPTSVWALACDAALISAKLLVRASRGASDLALALLLRSILL